SASRPSHLRLCAGGHLRGEDRRWPGAPAQGRRGLLRAAGRAACGVAQSEFHREGALPHFPGKRPDQAGDGAGVSAEPLRARIARAGRMRRRNFLTLVGSMAALPFAARAQQRSMPVIGYLVAGARATSTSIPAFLQGLRESGYVEGSNVTIEY